MERKKIFLASSSELEDDRKEFELFIGRKNKEWVPQGIHLHLDIWEDFPDMMSRTGLQSEYNRTIRESDIFIILFFTKVGKYTEEEFEQAFQQFAATSRPVIYTYFKEANAATDSLNETDQKSLLAFQNKLRALGHYYTRYKNIEDLKFQFSNQLDKLVTSGFIGLSRTPAGKIQETDPDRTEDEYHSIIGDNSSGWNIVVQGECNTVTLNLLNIRDLKSKLDEIKELESTLKSSGTAEQRLFISGLINKRTREVEEYKQNVLQVANSFSNISINTERLRLAKGHFDKGEFREADAILRAEDLVRDQKALLEAWEQKTNELENIGNQLEHNADEYLIKARLTALQYDQPDRFALACQYFELSLLSVRKSDSLVEYAKFLYKHNQYDKADPLFQEIIGLYEDLCKSDPVQFEPKIAGIYNSISLLNTSRNNFQTEESYYRKALEIYERHSIEDLNRFEPLIATTLINLATLYRRRNNLAAAEIHFLRGMEILERFSKIKPKTFEPELGRAVNNLANLYYAKNEFSLAETNYLKALEIYKRHYKRNPERIEPYIARVYNNLGILYRLNMKFDSARMHFEKALTIKSQLCKTNPEAFEPDLAKIYHSLALLHLKEKTDDIAEINYLKALEIYRRLAKTNREIFDSSIAAIYNDLSVIYFRKNDFLKSEEFLGKSMEIYERLAKSDPEIYQASVALINRNLSLVYSKKKDL